MIQENIAEEPRGNWLHMVLQGQSIFVSQVYQTLVQKCLNLTQEKPQHMFKRIQEASPGLLWAFNSQG